jgi:hypothetical protein
MALTKEEKHSAFIMAVEITKAYGPGGAEKYTPGTVLKDLYDTIKAIKEDVGSRD